MENKSSFNIPIAIQDKNYLRQYLEQLAIKIDELLGNRGDISSIQDLQLDIDTNTKEIDKLKIQVSINVTSINNIKQEYVKRDGSLTVTDELKYDDGITISDSNTLVNKDYVDSNFTNNPKQDSITSLNQATVTRSSTYEQSEAQTIADNVKEIADKVDDILEALRNSNIIT